MVMDHATGKVLIEKNSDKIYSPASLTKLMTAYVLLKEIERDVISVDDKIKVSKNAVYTVRKTKSSTMFLEIGESVSIDTILKGLIVHSGNDAAIAIAEHVAGTEENFAVVMNFYAKQLGMENSQFKNASGLPIKDHYSTSKDFVLLMSAMITEFNEEYLHYFSIKSYKHNDIVQQSRNKLLFQNIGFEGGKTGWHTSAGYCYVASVVKDGRRLLVATLKASKAKARFEDAIALTNYAYRFYDNYHLVKKGSSLNGFETLPVFKGKGKNVPVIAQDPIVITLPVSEYEQMTAQINLHKTKLIAPVKAGEIIGEIRFTRGEILVAKTNLVTKSAVPLGNWFDVMVDTLSLKVSN
jgi:D-alanyl-D-alanine carboxypeptidase (penicillin-binding protein 5/6)